MEFEDFEKKYNAFFFAYLKFVFKMLKKIIPAILTYSLLLFIFLSIYDFYGFDRTAIILFISFFLMRQIREIFQDARTPTRTP